MQPAPHDIQLMSKHRVLSLKSQLRLEWQGQDGQSETEQPDHFASLGDSITSSTRIRFSVPTGVISSCAIFITTTPELKFSVHTGCDCRRRCGIHGRASARCALSSPIRPVHPPRRGSIADRSISCLDVRMTSTLTRAIQRQASLKCAKNSQIKASQPGAKAGTLGRLRRPSGTDGFSF